MEIIYLPQAEEDLSYWVKTGNKSILKKIALLTRAVVGSPYKGIGKPEPLKYELAPKWSRRVTKEHRFVYQVLDDKIYVFLYVAIMYKIRTSLKNKAQNYLLLDFVL